MPEFSYDVMRPDGTIDAVVITLDDGRVATFDEMIQLDNELTLIRDESWPPGLWMAFNSDDVPTLHAALLEMAVIQADWRDSHPEMAGLRYNAIIWDDVTRPDPHLIPEPQ